MKTGTLLTKWMAVLCAALLMISLFAIPTFADTTSASDTTGTTEADTTTETTASTTDKTETTGQEDKTEATTTNKDDKKDEEANKGLDVTAIVWIIVGIVLVIAAVVLGIKYREKIAKGLRVYKSEFKKVSWLSWEQTRKSTLVVVVVLLVFAAVICLLDIALFKGFDLLLDAFRSMFQQ